jgi:thiamine pyrophosphokinase
MGTHVTLICRDEPLPEITGAVIGVDAGAAYALRNRLNMVLAVGDFDSIDPTIVALLQEHTEVETHPTDKDLPDSALAIEAALKRGFTEITIYGALGGRIDHQHANLVLCTRYPQITLVDAQHRVKAYPVGHYTVDANQLTTFSLFCFEAACVSLSDCAYPLDHYRMVPNDILGLSNRFISKAVELTVHEGTILIIQTKA